MTAWAGPVGVGAVYARQNGPHAREAIRDIPESCRCRWDWDPAAERWLRLIPVRECAWRHPVSTAAPEDVHK